MAVQNYVGVPPVSFYVPFFHNPNEMVLSFLPSHAFNYTSQQAAFRDHFDRIARIRHEKLSSVRRLVSLVQYPKNNNFFAFVKDHLMTTHTFLWFYSWKEKTDLGRVLSELELSYELPNSTLLSRKVLQNAEKQAKKLLRIKGLTKPVVLKDARVLHSPLGASPQELAIPDIQQLSKIAYPVLQEHRDPAPPRYNVIHPQRSRHGNSQEIEGPEELLRARNVYQDPIINQEKQINPTTTTIRMFNCAKDLLNQQFPFPNVTRSLDKNSATTAQELLADAENVVFNKRFLGRIMQISKSCPFTTVVKAVDGQYIFIKRIESLIPKINGDMVANNISEVQAVQEIGDALRTTITFETRDELRCVVQEVERWIKHKFGQISWKNFYLRKKSDGYVGVHGKIVFPFMTETGLRKIRGELQLHFQSISKILQSQHQIYKLPQKSMSTHEIFLINVYSKQQFLDAMALEYEHVSHENLMKNCQKTRYFQENNLCEDPVEDIRLICSDSFQVSRVYMPQIHHNQTSDFLNDMHLNHSVTVVRVEELIPIENEIFWDRVGRFLERFARNSTDSPCNNVVYVSEKNPQGKRYIIDGHHRFAACKLVGGPNQTVVAIEDGFLSIILKLKDWLIKKQNSSIVPV